MPGPASTAASKKTENPATDSAHARRCSIGLVNLGNSCFFNTIVQSLAISGPLSDLIADPPSSSPALDALLNHPEDTPASPLPISAAFVALINKLSPAGAEERGGALLFNPKALLRQLSIKYPDYQQATQQDAHELLMHLYEGVSMEERDLIKTLAQAEPKQDEHKHRRRRGTLRGGMSPFTSTIEEVAEPRTGVTSSNASVKTADGNASEDGVGESGHESSSESSTESEAESSDSSADSDEDDAGHSHSHAIALAKPRPFIESLFGGNLASIIVCDECKQISLTREEFMDISLSLKDDQSRIRKRDRIRKTLASGFFSKKSGSDAKQSKDSRQGPHVAASISDEEGYSASSDDEFDVTEADLNRTKSRSNSLDPSSNQTRRPNNLFAMSSIPRRDPSPSGINRALSVLSGRSSQPGSTKTGGSSRLKPRIPKPSAEQVAYIRTALAEVPGPGPNPALANLRVANPPGSQTSLASRSSNGSVPQARWVGAGPDPNTTDLFDSFRQFTAVESLEGDNAFACKNCWKLLNPELVRRHLREKLLKRQARSERKLEKKRARIERRRQDTVGPPAITNTAPSTQDGETRSDVANLGGGREGVAPASFTSSPQGLVSVQSLLSEVSLESEDLLADGEEADAPVDPSRAAAAEAAVRAPALPLTEANLSAVPPASPAPKPARQLAQAAASVASTSRRSGASFSTRHSVASLGAPASIPGSTATTGTTNNGATLPPGAPMPPKSARHVMRKASKRYLLHGPSLPPALVIHLKRFQNANKSSMFGTSFKNLQKRDDPFSFPLEMDLLPFLAPREKPPKSRGLVRGVDPKPRRMGEDKVGETRYRLSAIVCHEGTLTTGHYVAYCLSDRYRIKGHAKDAISKAVGSSGALVEGVASSGTEGEQPAVRETSEGVRAEEAAGVPRRWFFCSDEDVRACSVEEVLRSKAYMLFYERLR